MSLTGHLAFYETKCEKQQRNGNPSVQAYNLRLHVFLENGVQMKYFQGTSRHISQTRALLQTSKEI